MKLLANAYRALRGLVRRDEMETQLDDEMRHHLDLETAANVQRGLGPEEARRAGAAMEAMLEVLVARLRPEPGAPNWT